MPAKPVPVPVPPGHHYCYPCERTLPAAAFYTRKDGRLCRPCKECAKAAKGHSAKLEAVVEQARAEMQDYFASRPAPPPPVEREYAPMSGFALWLDVQAAKATKRKRAAPARP